MARVVSIALSSGAHIVALASQEHCHNIVCVRTLVGLHHKVIVHVSWILLRTEPVQARSVPRAHRTLVLLNTIATRAPGHLSLRWLLLLLLLKEAEVQREPTHAGKRLARLMVHRRVLALLHPLSFIEPGLANGSACTDHPSEIPHPTKPVAVLLRSVRASRSKRSRYSTNVLR